MSRPSRPSRSSRPPDPGPSGSSSPVRSRARPSVVLAELVGELITPACRRRGVAELALMLAPEDLFGERFAQVAAVERIVWPKGARIDDGSSGATLVVRADAGAALALQHMSAQVIERVNLAIGWPAVARLRLTQAGARPRRTDRPGPAVPPPRDAAREAEVAAGLGDVEHPELKAALSRLGARIAPSPGTAGTETP